MTDEINTNTCWNCLHGKPNRIFKDGTFKDSNKHWDVYCKLLNITKHPESNCMKLKLK